MNVDALRYNEGIVSFVRMQDKNAVSYTEAQAAWNLPNTRYCVNFRCSAVLSDTSYLQHT